MRRPNRSPGRIHAGEERAVRREFDHGHNIAAIVQTVEEVVDARLLRRNSQCEDVDQCDWIVGRPTTQQVATRQPFVEGRNEDHQRTIWNLIRDVGVIEQIQVELGRRPLVARETSFGRSIPFAQGVSFWCFGRLQGRDFVTVYAAGSIGLLHRSRKAFRNPSPERERKCDPLDGRVILCESRSNLGCIRRDQGHNTVARRKIL